jgi:hypothetical protein
MHQYSQQIKLTVCETELLATILALNADIVPIAIAPICNLDKVVVTCKNTVALQFREYCFALALFDHHSPSCRNTGSEDTNFTPEK